MADDLLMPEVRQLWGFPTPALSLRAPDDCTQSLKHDPAQICNWVVGVVEYEIPRVPDNRVLDVVELTVARHNRQLEPLHLQD